MMRRKVFHDLGVVFADQFRVACDEDGEIANEREKKSNRRST
jgi:hypothetical protein